MSVENYYIFNETFKINSFGRLEIKYSKCQCLIIYFFHMLEPAVQLPTKKVTVSLLRDPCIGIIPAPRSLFSFCFYGNFYKCRTCWILQKSCWFLGPDTFGSLEYLHLKIFQGSGRADFMVLVTCSWISKCCYQDECIGLRKCPFTITQWKRKGNIHWVL